MSGAVRGAVAAGKAAVKQLVRGAVAGTKEGTKQGARNVVKEHGTAVARNLQSALARMSAGPASFSAAAGLGPLDLTAQGSSALLVPIPEQYPRVCSCDYAAVAANPRAHPADPREGKTESHRILKCDSCAPFRRGPIQYLGDLRSEMPRREQPAREVKELKEKNGGGKRTRRRRLTRRKRTMRRRK